MSCHPLLSTRSAAFTRGLVAGVRKPSRRASMALLMHGCHGYGAAPPVPKRRWTEARGRGVGRARVVQAPMGTLTAILMRTDWASVFSSRAFGGNPRRRRPRIQGHIARSVTRRGVGDLRLGRASTSAVHRNGAPASGRRIGYLSELIGPSFPCRGAVTSGHAADAGFRNS